MKWPMFPLDIVADVFGGSTPRRNRSEYWDGNIPWVTPTDLPMPGTEIADVYDTTNHITPEGLRSCAANLLPVGTVLYSSRATIGKIGIARVPLATNQGFANFAPKPGVESKYLAYALQYFTVEISSLAGSTTFKEIRRGTLKKYKVPLPSPTEQRRIVEILDHADALRKKRAEADAKAARILPALFYKMFGDPSSNTAKERFQIITEFAKIIMGQSPPGDTYNNTQDGLPFFQGKLDFGDINPVPRKWCSAPSRIAEQGDVLLCVRAPVGPTNLADQKCCIGRGLAAIRPIQNKSTSEFLLYSIRAQERQIARAGQGSTFNAIRRQDVEGILIPNADIDAQDAFSKIAQGIQRLHSNQGNNGNHLELLFSTLLHRAFTGDLTAQWREAHMKELLAEMEQQAKVLNLRMES